LLKIHFQVKEVEEEIHSREIKELIVKFEAEE